MRLLLATLLLAATCASDPGPARPRVLVSLAPHAFVVEWLVGDRVDVDVLVPPGARPHDHEPSEAQIRRAETAALWLRVGHPDLASETRLAQALPADAGPRSVDLYGDKRVRGDPHVWLEPLQMRSQAHRISRALQELLPEQKEHIDARFEEFTALTRETRSAVRQILLAAQGHRFFASTEAWTHFGGRLGVEPIVIDPADPQAARARIGERGPFAIVIQPQVGSEAARELAEELDMELVEADPLAYDWPENLRAVARAIAFAATGVRRD